MYGFMDLVCIGEPRLPHFNAAVGRRNIACEMVKARLVVNDLKIRGGKIFDILHFSNVDDGFVKKNTFFRYSKNLLKYSNLVWHCA